MAGRLLFGGAKPAYIFLHERRSGRHCGRWLTPVADGDDRSDDPGHPEPASTYGTSTWGVGCPGLHPTEEEPKFYACSGGSSGTMNGW